MRTQNGTNEYGETDYLEVMERGKINRARRDDRSEGWPIRRRVGRI